MLASNSENNALLGIIKLGLFPLYMKAHKIL